MGDQAQLRPEPGNIFFFMSLLTRRKKWVTTVSVQSIRRAVSWGGDSNYFNRYSPAEISHLRLNNWLLSTFQLVSWIPNHSCNPPFYRLDMTIMKETKTKQNKRKQKKKKRRLILLRVVAETVAWWWLHV